MKPHQETADPSADEVAAIAAALSELLQPPAVAPAVPPPRWRVAGRAFGEDVAR